MVLGSVLGVCEETVLVVLETSNVFLTAYLLWFQNHGLGVVYKDDGGLLIDVEDQKEVTKMRLCRQYSTGFILMIDI